MNEPGFRVFLKNRTPTKIIENTITPTITPVTPKTAVSQPEESVSFKPAGPSLVVKGAEVVFMLP